MLCRWQEVPGEGSQEHSGAEGGQRASPSHVVRGGPGSGDGVGVVVGHHG